MQIVTGVSQPSPDRASHAVMKAPFSTLTICGLEELEAQGTRGVTHVLSIIDPDLPDPPVFGGWGAHRRTVLRFHDAIAPDPGILLPEPSDVEAVLAFGRDVEADGGDVDGHLLVHCHMGISRSSAAMIMLVAQAHPEEAETAVAGRIRELRPIAWPNLRMIEFADAILGRDGRLVDAAGGLYARSLAAKPELAEVMTRINRRQEVELGLRTAA